MIPFGAKERPLRKGEADSRADDAASGPGFTEGRRVARKNSAQWTVVSEQWSEQDCGEWAMVSVQIHRRGKAKGRGRVATDVAVAL